MLSDLLKDKTIAVIGGTGKLGAALAGRWRAAGLAVVVGSRSGTPYAEAAAAADIIVVTVPFAAQAEALTSVLVFLNRTYKSDGAGLRITALPDLADPTA